MIELYALGSLAPDEMREVENMVAQYPEVKAELLRVQKDLEDYATTHAINPDPSLQEYILNSALHPEENETLRKPEVSAKWRSAAVFFLLVALIATFFAMNEVKKAGVMSDALRQFAYNDSVALNRRINDSLEKISDSKRIDSLLQQIAFLKDTLTHDIMLNSVVKGHPMKSVVHWNMKTMDVMIDPMSLPRTDVTSKYVFWAIVNGVPVNEGSFAMDPQTGMIKMDRVMKADAFAISLEKDDKVTKPAGPVYVLGSPPSIK
jgi:anti-sigma-K factor RskA